LDLLEVIDIMEQILSPKIGHDVVEYNLLEIPKM